MAAELESDLDAECELIAGDRGIFDVAVDGTLVFSKHSTGRFPGDGELTKIIREQGNRT